MKGTSQEQEKKQLTIISRKGQRIKIDTHEVPFDLKKGLMLENRNYFLFSFLLFFHFSYDYYDYMTICTSALGWRRFSLILNTLNHSFSMMIHSQLCLTICSPILHRTYSDRYYAFSSLINVLTYLCNTLRDTYSDTRLRRTFYSI